MGNRRRSREVRQESERQADWERLRSEPWLPDQLFRAFGSGKPRVQLIHLPSFTPPRFWEVCQSDDKWLLYRADVLVGTHREPIRVRGYERMEAESAELEQFFLRVISLNLPVAPDLTNRAGLERWCVSPSLAILARISDLGGGRNILPAGRR
jgi:hypothetical protein